MKNISVKYKLMCVIPLFTLVPSCANYNKVVVNQKTSNNEDSLLNVTNVTKDYGDKNLDVQQKSDTLVIWGKGAYYLYGRFGGR